MLFMVLYDLIIHPWLELSLRFLMMLALYCPLEAICAHCRKLHFIWAEAVYSELFSVLTHCPMHLISLKYFCMFIVYNLYISELVTNASRRHLGCKMLHFGKELNWTPKLQTAQVNYIICFLQRESVFITTMTVFVTKTQDRRTRRLTAKC